MELARAALAASGDERPPRAHGPFDCLSPRSLNAARAVREPAAFAGAARCTATCPTHARRSTAPRRVPHAPRGRLASRTHEMKVTMMNTQNTIDDEMIRTFLKSFR
eukprot:5938060-Prymnesium_polylepis.1